jgi:hypothetical protein
MRGIIGIQVVEGQRIGRRGPFHFHSMASFHTALGTSIYYFSLLTKLYSFRMVYKKHFLS